nr:MAG TPA: hypothetical protein [Caudoviricetes sp.]
MTPGGITRKIFSGIFFRKIKARRVRAFIPE